MDKLFQLNITQLDAVGPLMHQLDDITIDWTIDCDDVEIITSRLKFIIPIATLELSTDSTPSEIFDAIYERLVLIVQNN